MKTAKGISGKLGFLYWHHKDFFEFFPQLEVFKNSDACSDSSSDDDSKTTRSLRHYFDKIYKFDRHVDNYHNFLKDVLNWGKQPYKTWADAVPDKVWDKYFEYDGKTGRVER